VVSGTVTVTETSAARSTLLIRRGSTLVVVPSSSSESAGMAWIPPVSSNQTILAPALVPASITNSAAAAFTAAALGDAILSAPLPYSATMGLQQRAIPGQPSRFQYVTAAGPEFVLFVRVES
jgi:hypothetical protein